MADLLPALPPDLRRTLGGAGGALANGWAHFLGGGVERVEPTPSVVVARRPHGTVRRYDTGGTGRPILLVPPLAVSIACYDLRPGQSLVAFLVGSGRPVYVVDYGDVGFADRHLGLEKWIDGILPDSVRTVSAEHEDEEVDVAAWSLGGTLAFLTAAAHADLPVRSVAALGTPIDYAKVAYLAPIRAVARLTGGHLVGTAGRLLGGMPSWAVRASFKATALQRELTKPWFVLRNLADAETLARMEAVDNFIASMPGYPGRLYGQIYSRLVVRNDLARGRLRLRDREIRLAAVRQRVLLVAGTGDAIAPVAAVRAGCDVLTGAASLRLQTVPGSHLGIVAGTTAPATTWQHLAEFLAG